MEIYIGDISHKIIVPQFRKSFKKSGKVTLLNIVMNKKSGIPRGFASIEMFSDRHYEKTITSLLGKDLAGSWLKVKEAKGNRILNKRKIK